MIFNTVVRGSATDGLIKFLYTGDYTDNRDADGKGTVRFNTSGTLSVLSGKAVVSVYILGGGGGGALSGGSSGPRAKSGGGSGGYLTVDKELETGDYEIIIGSGGAGKSGTSAATGATGGETVAFGYTCTGGSGGYANKTAATGEGGAGGSPYGNNGEYSSASSSSPATALGGSPNGGSASKSGANDGGDGYVEITFF